MSRERRRPSDIQYILQHECILRRLLVEDLLFKAVLASRIRLCKATSQALLNEASWGSTRAVTLIIPNLVVPITYSDLLCNAITI
jgi:hypothetical protein